MLVSHFTDWDPGKNNQKESDAVESLRYVSDYFVHVVDYKEESQAEERKRTRKMFICVSYLPEYMIERVIVRVEGIWMDLKKLNPLYKLCFSVSRRTGRENNTYLKVDSRWLHLMSVRELFVCAWKLRLRESKPPKKHPTWDNVFCHATEQG